MTVLNFFLTRHGETQWNKIGKFQGQLDSPLTDKGYQQAHAIAELLSSKSINLIVSSTLARAKTTAETCQLALNCPLSLKSALIERNFGDWQGEFIEGVQKKANYHAIFHQVNHIAPANGESGIACAKRFHQALTDIAQSCLFTSHVNKDTTSNTKATSDNVSNILVVSHGDILRCFLSAMVKNFATEHAINTENKAFDNGCVFQLSYDSQTQNFTLLSALDITQASSTVLSR